MHNIGDVTQLGGQELNELVPEAPIYEAGQQETGNLAPQDLVENSTVVRLATQFSWGSRYAPPFVHSNDSTSSFVATFGKYGK